MFGKVVILTLVELLRVVVGSICDGNGGQGLRSRLCQEWKRFTNLYSTNAVNFFLM